MSLKRVFIDNDGRFYKALTARDPSHAERPLVTADFLQALPDNGDPLYLVDIDAKVLANVSTKRGS